MIRLKIGCSIFKAGETVRYDSRVVRRMTKKQVLGSDTHLSKCIFTTCEFPSISVRGPTIGGGRSGVKVSKEVDIDGIDTTYNTRLVEDRLIRS